MDPPSTNQIATEPEGIRLFDDASKFFVPPQPAHVPAHLLSPDSVTTRGTHTPRTVATNTAENSPRQSECETCGSDEEGGIDKQFQLLLQNVAENVAEIALDDVKPKRHSLHNSTLTSPTLAFQSETFRFSQDLHSDMRLFRTPRRFSSSPPATSTTTSMSLSPSSSPLPFDILGGAGQVAGAHPNQTRPEWQKICIQHSVCIHNIYGNCAYGLSCYYYHLESFHKPELLYKTELCRYGMECANRPRCCFAHTKKERRTPEQNVRDALAKPRAVHAPSPISHFAPHPHQQHQHHHHHLHGLVSPVVSRHPIPMRHLHQGGHLSLPHLGGLMGDSASSLGGMPQFPFPYQ